MGVISTLHNPSCYAMLKQLSDSKCQLWISKVVNLLFFVAEDR